MSEIVTCFERIFICQVLYLNTTFPFSAVKPDVGWVGPENDGRYSYLPKSSVFELAA